MMSYDEYNEYWRAIGFDEQNVSDPKERMLVRHILALWDRIDMLMSPDDHDKVHGQECKCYNVHCACSYDYPTSVCMFHKKEES